MEKRKRVYPIRTNGNRLLCGMLLTAALMVFLSGFMFRNKTDSFFLEPMPEQTELSLNETFDETPSETVIDLPEYRWFALQTGVFEKEEAARQSALAFQKRGAAGYLWKDGRFRVLAAVYPTQEDARYVREQLLEQHTIDSYIYNVTFPAVTLRLKGMQGQLEILQAALTHAHDLSAALQRIAVAIDRQEISVQDAVTQIQALHTQLDIVALRIQQRFPAPVPQTLKALLECFEEFAVFSDELTSSESAAALGMKLKYQTFAVLWNIQKIYQTLDHT